MNRIAESDGPSPATRRELAACLGPMVAQLPPLYRDAVRLADLEGLPQHEAAARAGITLSGMKSRVQRGRKALRQILDACCQIDLDAGGRVTDYHPRANGCGPCGQGQGCARDHETATDRQERELSSEIELVSA
jgi:RNA polymerase sigma-70 factor (ECF subfamily)